ncbi:MAG: putative Ig domain-containing protein [Bryobacteraceae bacterium]
MKRPIFALVLPVALLALSGVAEAQAIRANPGFNSNSVPRNDDGSSPLQPLGFTINLFGKIRSNVFVNNNGNITFDSSLSTFTPFGLKSTAREIIAPFFADVDTRNPDSKLVTYGQDVINGHRAFGANYIDVGYYASHVDKTNSFQLVLIERADQGPGDFDIEFNYGRIAWETGDASGGVNGFGGTPAAAGWSNGGDTSYELPGSLIAGAFLDNGPYALVRQAITGAVVNTTSSQSNAKAGRLIFRARDGVISPGLVISGGQLPDATTGVPYSQALTVAGADPPFRWTFQPDVIAPPGLALSATGVLAGTPTAQGTYSFTVGVTGNSEDGEITVFERGSVTVRQAALRITSSCPLPDAFVGSPYSQTLTSAGALGVVWSLRDPLALPQGLSLSTGGLLAGTPQVPGTFSVILEAKTADGSAVPVQSLCKLNVAPSAILLRPTGGCALQRSTVGVPFSQILQPTGGFAPYTFELLGQLPQGVALTREGLVAGTPGFWGVWLFKIATTDSRGTRAEIDCSIIVDPARFNTSVCPLPSGVTGQPYSADLGGGYTWSVLGTLPGGLKLSPDGKINGTPMVAGGAQFILLATNSKGEPSVEACSLVVERGSLALSGCPLPDARAGEPYSASLTGLGGSAPYFFSTVAGSWPAGVSLTPSGQISGTPTVAGSYPFTLRLRDGTQTSTLQACQLTVVPAELRLSTACPLPDGRVGEAYTQTLQASGGAAPYQFSFNLLPDGLTGTTAGAISGSPSRLGGRSFDVRITDAANRSTTQVCSLAIGQPVVPAISLLDPPATVSAASTSLGLTVQLAAAYTAPVKGQLTMKITPETAGTDPIVNSADPLLAFANGQRTVPFTIAAGATRVTLPVASTGTVASTVGVFVEGLEASGAPISQYPTAKFFRIVPAVPTITTACYVRTNSEEGIHLDFKVTGFSNTRELTKALVTIPGLAGAQPNIPVPAEFVFNTTDTLAVDANGVATAYYSSAVNVRTGGAFTLTIPVTLNALAPIAKLDGVQFSLANHVGPSAQKTVQACP